MTEQQLHLARWGECHPHQCSCNKRNQWYAEMMATLPGRPKR